MLNPSEDRDVNNIYQLSTEKARNWWNMQGFESRKNIVIESDAVINDDKLVEDQTIADIADKDYDDLPDVTKQEVELQVEDEENMEELFEVEDEEYLKCGICGMSFTTNEDYDIHRSVDHGEEPEDLEESEETYQLTMHPELTRESLREANDLLRETKPTQLYSGYDKNGDVQSSIMPYNLPPVATGKYNDNPNEFFYSNKIFKAGNSALRTSSLGESKASEDWEEDLDGYKAIGKAYKEKQKMDKSSESDGMQVDWWDSLSQDERSNYMNSFSQINNTYPVSGSIYMDNYDEMDSSNQYYVNNLFKFVKYDMDNDLLGRKHDLLSESRASETNYFHSLDSSAEDILYRWLETQNESVTGEELPKYLWDEIEKTEGGSRLNSDDIQNYIDDYFNTDYEGESTDRFEADIENDQVVQKLPDDKRSFDVEAKLPRQMDFKTGGYAGKNEWGGDATLCEICGTKFNTYPEFLDHYQTHDEANGPEFYESKSEEKGEWDWLDKGADSKSVDYDEVKYGDDGVSDISIQNTEPKGADANEFLDNVYIGVESVDYVYPTKASEAMEKTYIPVSETFEEDYEEFEDSDEVMIKETITLRKLTGYGDDAIARELHINYGVSHEEALEKVYSVEVSTNDRVSQTFFGKMYKECTESEKDELQMYSGSD